MKNTVFIISMVFALSRCYPSKNPCPDRCTCASNTDDSKIQKSSTTVRCLGGNVDERAFQKIMSAMPRDVSHLHIIGRAEKPNRFSITQDFERFNRLTELHLVNCGLTSLAKRTFENVKSLRLLNVAGNLIESVTPETFENTEHLLSLNLSGNRLHSKIIPTGAFAYLRNLISLDLSKNGIENFGVSNLLSGLYRLERLALDGNVLKPKNFDMLMDVPKLESLSLAGCQLSDVPDNAFAKNPHLKSLNLAKNKLKSSFVAATKNVPRLETLDLSENWITAMSDNTFLHVPNLKTLILQGNFVGTSTSSYQLQYTRSASLRGRIDLQEIDLSQNGITIFKSSYMRSAVISLKTLKLSSNNLSLITEEQTKNMQNLKRLYLANTNLANLPDALPSEYGNLEHLDLSNNFISGFTRNQTNTLQYLISLDLSFNNFTRLTDYERRFLSKMKRVALNDNPWDCHHCRTLMNLNMIFQNHSDYQRSGDNVTCGMPMEFVGKSVKSVYKLTACSKTYGAIADKSGGGESEYNLMIAGLCALTFIVTMTVLVICCYAWKKQEATPSGGSSQNNANLNPNMNRNQNNTEETITLSSASSSDHDRIIS